MTLFELQFFLGTTYFFYVLSLLIFHSKLRRFYFLGVTPFLISSYYLRILVPIHINADFEAYQAYLSENYTFGLTSLFKEPYLPLIYKFIYLYINSDNTLEYVYWLNFLISATFYVWISTREKIKIWIKIIMFSLTYIFFTYTVLRNSPAYFLFAVFIYYLLQNRRVYSGYLSFIAHISVLPAVAASFLGFSKPSYKQMLLILLGAISFSVIISFSIFSHVSENLDVYTSDEVREKFGASAFHKVYFIVFLLVNIFIYRINKKVIFNNFYIALLLVYIILNILNPVMAYRFSFYNILYLTTYPFYKKLKLDTVLTIAIILFCFGIYYFGFLESHSSLKTLK